TLWQSVQTATLVSPAARRLPCMLVWYWSNWSVRRLGLNCRMYAGLEWQEPHNCGICLRSILPFHPALRLIAWSGSSLAASPPWQLAQVKPFWAWMSWLNVSWVTPNGSGNAEWQSRQEFLDWP